MGNLYSFQRLLSNISNEAERTEVVRAIERMTKLGIDHGYSKFDFMSDVEDEGEDEYEYLPFM